MKEKFEELTRILEDIKRLVDSPYTVIDWSKYNTVEDVLRDLDSFIKRLNSQDESAIEELEFFFAPTGSLQEIYIGSGWGEKYLEIANRFEELLK